MTLHRALAGEADGYDRQREMPAVAGSRVAGVAGGIVAEFESLDAAQEWAAADPYVAAGVYAGVKFKPFKLVFPK